MGLIPRNFILIVMSIMWLSLSALAKNGSVPKEVKSNFAHKPEVIELKAKIEQAITKNYKDRISTQVDSSYFSVSVQVSLAQVAPVAPIESKSGEDGKSNELPQAQTTSEIPADTSLGQIKLNPVFDKFKNELKATENGKNALSDLFLETWMKQVQLTKVEVFVGLDKEFDETYKKQFSDWLSKVVKSEFGAVGNHKIFNIAKVKKIEPPKEPLTLYEQLSRFQVTLGLIVLSSALLRVSKIFEGSFSN